MPASHLRDVVVLMCAATLYQCGRPAKTTLHPTSLPPLTPESVSVAAEPELAIVDLPSAALSDSIRKYRFMSHQGWDKGEKPNSSSSASRTPLGPESQVTL